MTGSRLAKVALAVAVIAAVVAAYATGFGGAGTRSQVEAWLASLGAAAPLGFLVVKFVTVVLALPSAPMALVGGVLFGPVGGTVLNVTGATAGATVTFFLGRWIGRDAVEGRLGGRVADLDARLGEDGLWVMLFLRLVPLFPFNLINWGSGLTRITLRDYLVGTALGIVPGAFVFTWIGHSAAGGSPFGLTLGLCALGLLALLPAFVRRRKEEGR